MVVKSQRNTRLITETSIPKYEITGWRTPATLALTG
jgi:hypothetical protein